VLAGAADLDAVLLALSAGRPVVAPDLPAIRAVAGAAMMSCESAEDAGGMARAIERLLADSTLRLGLTEAAQARRAVLSWQDADALLTTLWSPVPTL
jgi:glycosyltransferase involved in cell wall biosynthesis